MEKEKCIQEVKNFNIPIPLIEKVVNTFMEDKEKENETRLTSFVHSQSIKLKKKEKEYEKKLDEREKNLPEEKERELKEKEEVIAGLQQEKVELVKRVEELEQNLSRVQSINSQLSADVTLLRSTFKTNQTEIDTKIKDLEDRLAAEKKREGLKAAAYNYSSEVSNYYLKHSLLPLLTTTSGYASFVNSFKPGKKPPKFEKYFELNYYKDPDIIALAKNNHNIDLTLLYDLIFKKKKTLHILY